MSSKQQLSFLPEPKYNPIYPSETSLAFKALRLMLQGMKVAHPDFEAATGSWRLAAHVHTLKKLGWPVQVEYFNYDWDGHKVDKRHIGFYYLPKELIELMYNQ